MSASLFALNWWDRAWLALVKPCPFPNGVRITAELPHCDALLFGVAQFPSVFMTFDLQSKCEVFVGFSGSLLALSDFGNVIDDLAREVHPHSERDD